MGLLEKVKNFFYDEEIDEEESDFEEIKKKEVSVKSHHKERMERHSIKDEEISERELFKVERTFNFPMDVDDTEDSVKEENINDIVRIPIKEEKEKNKYNYDNTKKDNAYTGIRSYASNTTNVVSETKVEEKKFKPTPVISPIYGVLDKNYKKEDLNLEVTREFDVPKKLDYDTVRRKAYGPIKKQEEVEETKGIFFNLDEEKKEEFDSEDDEVKIIYNDVTFEEENEEIPQEDLSDEEVHNEENIKEGNELQEDEDENILSESNEEDLFNLIDNMYNSDDDEDEEDEE